MYIGKIRFNSLPDIGFAIRHYSGDYKVTYGRNPKLQIEIACINSGNIRLYCQNTEMYAPEGSVVVIFRHLPISTTTVGECVHSHDTVLGEFEDLDFELSDTSDVSGDVLSIPFVTMPSEKTAKIGLRLRRIISDMSRDRENSSFSASVEFVSILKEISDIYTSGKSNIHSQKTVAKIKNYIDENIQSRITMGDIASLTGKSCNHVGQIFKKGTGMTVTEYANMQKVKKISLLIKSREKTFKQACEEVCVYDEAYGYRLFKKYMGLTPGEFLSVKHIDRDKKK